MKNSSPSLLNDLEKIKSLDASGMEALLRNFSGQIENAIRIGESFQIPRTLRASFDKILFVGMGGSAIGGDVLRSLMGRDSPVPITVSRHYELPRFVDARTLSIFSSYSGNTEETLAAFHEARKRGVKGLIITSGGELGKLSGKTETPWIRIPSGFPPRLALGYSVFPLLKLMAQLKLGKWDGAGVKETVALLRSLAVEYGIAAPEKSNPAKQAASSLAETLVVVYASTGLLECAALRFRNQIEENAKALASHHLFPELNHNEILGWKFPKKVLARSAVVFLKDAGDHARNLLRMKITKEVIEKSGVPVLELASQGKSPLVRLFSTIYLGDWISYYLAILYGVDPTPVKVIEFLKGELAKTKG